MKRLWIALAVALMLVASPVVAAAMKIGYVDLQRALVESDAGKAAQTRMGQRVSEVQTTAQERQQRLRIMQEELEQKTLMLSAEAKTKKEQDFEQQRREFQRFLQDAQEQLQREEGRLGQGIIEGLGEVIRTIGEREGYTLILELAGSALLYANEAIDLTEKVITEYNRVYKAGGGR